MAKAAIFDKDGVIVETTRLHFEKWKRTFATYNKKLTQSYHLTYISGRSARENVKTHLDPNISEEDLTKVLQDQLSFILKMFDRYVTVVPGIKDFLKKLKSHNIPMALATSSRRESTDYVVEELKIRPYFKSILTEDDVSHSKPDSEIYLKSAEKLRVNPTDCVVFEDSLSGVEAAKRAGMKVVLVMTSHTHKEIPAVDMAIKDFTKLSFSDVGSI